MERLLEVEINGINKKHMGSSCKKQKAHNKANTFL